MADQATLSLSIDASAAKKGAAEFSRAVEDIKKKAAEVDRVIKQSNRAFRDMRGASNGNSDTFSTTAQSVFSGTVEGSATISSEVRPLLGNILGFIFDIKALISDIKALSLEEKLRKNEIARLTKSTDNAAKEQILRAKESTGERREQARSIAIDNFEISQNAEFDDPETAGFLDAERKILELLKTAERDVGNNVFLANPDRLTPDAKTFIKHLRKIETELAEFRARNAARGEAAAFLTLDPLPQPDRKAEPEASERLPSGSDLSQANSDDDRVKQQIEDTTRSIDLLKEQKQTLEDGAAAATAQKEKELELLQREKECLERLNEALRENANLRQQTSDQTNTTIESEAANDNLADALESSGQAAQQLQTDVDGLNTALATNAGVNTEVVDGLNQELDARQQVNGAIVERRQLEEEQRQRLIQADDETKRRAEAVEEVFGDIRNAAKDSIKDVIKGTESIGDAFQKLADRITDILLDLALEELLGGGTGFSDVFGTVMGGIGSIFGGGAPANLAGPAGIGILPIGHQGGVIGQNRFPLRRFHDGGFPGLRPGEIPIIAQRGEEILARGDPRNAANNNAVGAGNVVVNVSFPNARNTQEAREAGSEIAARAAAAAQRGMARKGLG